MVWQKLKEVDLINGTATLVSKNGKEYKIFENRMKLYTLQQLLAFAKYKKGSLIVNLFIPSENSVFRDGKIIDAFIQI